MAALTGTETLEVLPTQINGMPAAYTETVTTAQIAALASNFSNDFPSSVTTVGNGTLLAATLITGLLNRTGPTAPFTDTTDTAANIVAALGGTVGDSFYIDIKNATAFPQTLVGGTGVTLSSSSIVPPNSLAEFLVVITTATAITFNHVFTVPLTTDALQVATTLSTVGAGTITAAGIAGTITTRTGSQSATAFTDTTDTAANIITAQPNAHVGQSWIYFYQNATNAPATITGGTGVTVSGVTVAQANSTSAYLVTYTAAATITMMGLGSTANFVGGTFTATGASAVTVANAQVSPNSQVNITLKTVGGTVGAFPTIKTITAGTGFTVTATAADTSVYNYSIMW